MTGPRLPGLRAELIERAARQHAARQGVEAAEPTADDTERINAVHEENVRWFATVVATAGWPGRRLVGADGTHAAFALARCAPTPYRAAWLPKARSAAHHGDVSQRAVQLLAAQVEADRRTAWVR
jgi:hypothetical protein